MSQKSKKTDLGLDIVTPFVDILGVILEVLLELIKHFLLWGTGYISKNLFGKTKITPVEIKHLKRKRFTKDSDSLGYSCNNKLDFKLARLNTTKHTAVIGSTGSGKTVCLRLLVEHNLKKNLPVIYFDPKASLESIGVFKRMCERAGKKLYLFTDITEDATAFNPLLGGNLDDISDKVINALDWSEPFYKNESIDALDTVLECLFKNKVTITLKNIVTELNKHTNKKNIKGLINQLQKVSNSQYGELLNLEDSSVMTFNKLRMENACLYIGINSMGHSSSGSILNKIFFGGLLTHAKDSLTNKVEGLIDPMSKPISIVFDELASTIHEGFIDLQNKCRQAGMEITYATQGPSDIDRISPILTSQIFENTNNLFIFNQIVPDHTEFFARMFGTITTEKKTHVIEDGTKVDMGTVRDVEEFLVHSNIFRNLRVGQCVLLQRIPKQVDLLNIRYWKETNKESGLANPTKQAELIF
jgi:type IV secretory pathway TraG/TraD family ATPase VirD4